MSGWIQRFGKSFLFRGNIKRLDGYPNRLIQPIKKFGASAHWKSFCFDAALPWLDIAYCAICFHSSPTPDALGVKMT